MTPEEKSLLERTYALTDENNRILHSIRRSNRLSAAMRIAYWVVIILFTLGAYYFIQPYLSILTGLVGGSSNNGTSSGSFINQATDAASQLKDLLK